MTMESWIKRDLATFADLGTDPSEARFLGDLVVVRLYRDGEDLELRFHDNGTGKVIERSVDTGESRQHASYRALLASEKFGNLRRWAQNQKTFLQEALKGAAPEIPVDGRLSDGDRSTNRDGLDEFLSSWERHDERSVQVMLIDGPAGIGKTRFIESVALSRAAGFVDRRRPLVLHVQSRGRVLTFLQDLIAFSLQRLRLTVTFDQVPVLIRNGLITLAIDGFDELSDPNGYDLAWSQVNELVDQIRGEGTLILAGRETFIGRERIIQNIVSLNECRDKVSSFSLRAPSPKVAKNWLRNGGWNDDHLKMSDDLFDADSYALRPFFLVQLADPETVKIIERMTIGSLLTFLVELMTEREAGKFGDAVDSLMDEEHRREFVRGFLREVARNMADEQTEALDERMIDWLAEVAAPADLGAETLAILKNRAAVMAFLENDDAPGYRRFTHSQIFNHFLGEETVDAVVHDEVPKYVRRNLLGADFLTAFSNVVVHLGSSRSGRVRQFFDAAYSVLRTHSWTDRTRRNIGAALLTMLPCMEEDARGLELRSVEVDEALMRGIAPPAKVHGAFVNQLDIRGADLQYLAFESTTIGTIIVDEATRVPASFPAPGRIRYEGFRGKRSTVIGEPDSIEGWLDKHGRSDIAGREETTGLVAADLREHALLKVLGRACRSKSHWIRLARENHFDRFVMDPGWPDILKLLDEHGLVVHSRRSAAGKVARFVHIKRSMEILRAVTEWESEDNNDAEISEFYRSLVDKIRSDVATSGLK